MFQVFSGGEPSMLGLRMIVLAVVILTGLVLYAAPAGVRADGAADRARKFVRDYETSVRPLERAVNLAWWNANTTGKDADFDAKKKAQNELDKALSDREAFRTVKELKEGGGISDPTLARCI